MLFLSIQLVILLIIAELSMGQLDQALTRPEPENNLKL